MEIAGVKIDKASKFACVRASTIIDAPLDQVLAPALLPALRRALLLAACCPLLAAVGR